MYKCVHEIKLSSKTHYSTNSSHTKHSHIKRCTKTILKTFTLHEKLQQVKKNFFMYASLATATYNYGLLPQVKTGLLLLLWRSLFSGYLYDSMWSLYQDTTNTTNVTYIFLYACKSWTLIAELKRRIQAMEVRFYCKILRISYKDHVTNEEVPAKIQQAIRPHEDLLTIVKRRKLQWYGHVSRSSGLAKTILQGTVKGGRRQGRQRKRWEDNIREWTGLQFTKS